MIDTLDTSVFKTRKELREMTDLNLLFYLESLIEVKSTLPLDIEDYVYTDDRIFEVQDEILTRMSR